MLTSIEQPATQTYREFLEIHYAALKSAKTVAEAQRHGLVFYHLLLREEPKIDAEVLNFPRCASDV